jgi:hypothetical protein
MEQILSQSYESTLGESTKPATTEAMRKTTTPPLRQLMPRDSLLKMALQSLSISFSSGPLDTSSISSVCKGAMGFSIASKVNLLSFVIRIANLHNFSGLVLRVLTKSICHQC